MSIADISKKIKTYSQDKAIPLFYKIKEGFCIKEDIFIVTAIILIGLAGFGLGRLSAMEKGRETVDIKPFAFNINPSTTDTADHLLVASKTGQKYHFPWCSGASQIAEKNKIYFDSYEQAQKAGYTQAANCPGLK